MQYPESFHCPLTHEVMQDPVIDYEGNSYERAAIAAWLSRNQTSPVTRSPLTEQQLTPNRALLDAIEQFEQLRAHAAENESLASEAAASVAASVAAPSARDLANTGSKVVSGSAAKPSPSVAAVESAIPTSTVTTKVPAVPSSALCDSFALSVTSRERNGDIVDALVTVRPPAGKEAPPVDIVAVVDISGSMGTEAKMMSNSKSGEVESHGLSLLDVVKHAVRTIAHILRPQDRLAIVTFHTTADITIKLTNMTDQGRKTLLAMLDKLCPEDCTNIWGGLSLGLDLLSEAAEYGSSNVGSIVLLTDGMPNIEPPRGHIPMLKRVLQEKRTLLENVTINTFGFGYKLDSKLLKDLASVGKGMYAFIPDSGFVGTAFVNATANILSTAATNCQLHVTATNGAVVLGTPGYDMREGDEEDTDEVDETIATPGGAEETKRFSIGSLQFGQPRHVVVSMRVPKASLLPSPNGQPFLTVRLTCRNTSAKKITMKAAANGVDNDKEVCLQLDRLEFVDAVGRVNPVDNSSSAEVFVALANKIKDRSGPHLSARTTALLMDINGEVTLAVSKAELWNKWGRHYLPSLSTAHLLEQSNNFKDPGIQHYGGTLFQQLRDRADDIFCKLPPPKPSVRRSNVTPVQSMARYHCRSNVCFHGDSLVLLADGTKKAVRNVSKGELLMVPGAVKPASVLCVLQTHCAKREALLVSLPSGLTLTPYHPVRNSKGQWTFPLHLAEPHLQHCEYVYSFVLDGGHQISINGVTCVTLGHSFRDNDVVQHEYFGSARVVEDLRKLQGWNTGRIHVRGGCLLRDSKSGLAVGFDSEAVLNEVDVSAQL